MRWLYRLIVDAITGWINHDAMTLAAAITFYFLFSLAPMVIVAVAMSGLFFDPQASRQDILEQTHMVLGEQPASFVGTLIDSYQEFASTGSLIIGGAILLYTAAVTFTALQEAMNRIWALHTEPDASWWAFFRKRLLSFVMVLALGGLLIAAMAVGQVLSFVGMYREQLPFGFHLLRVLNYIVAYLLVLAFMFLVFRFLPDASIPRRAVFIGAVVSSVLFIIGNVVIGLYLSMSGPTNAYGAVASALAFLLWAYYSALIFFFGAEIARAYTDRKRLPVEPASHVVRSPRASAKSG